MSINFLNVLIVLLAVGLLIYLATQKHWLSQALMHVLVGGGLYVLEIRKALDLGQCTFVWSYDLLKISAQVDTCVSVGNITVALAQVLLISGVLALLLVPIWNKHMKKEDHSA